MQREALLTNAAMTITQLTKECDNISPVTGKTFGCSSAALGPLLRNIGRAYVKGETGRISVPLNSACELN
jgi:hypothetical protein